MGSILCTNCKGIAGTAPVMKETSRTNMVDEDKTKLTDISTDPFTYASVSESDEVIVYTCPYCGFSKTVTTVFNDAFLGDEPDALQYS